MEGVCLLEIVIWVILSGQILLLAYPFHKLFLKLQSDGVFNIVSYTKLDFLQI
jgi:hypothetical protein